MKRSCCHLFLVLPVIWATVANLSCSRSKTPVAVDPSIVALIGDYQIKGQDFQERMLRELAPSPYDLPPTTKAVTREAVVRMLLAEKAIAMEARKQGLAQSEKILSAMKEFSERQLVSLLYARVVSTQVVVEEDEIERAMKVNSNLDRAQATMALQRNKARALFDDYTGRLFNMLHVELVPGNFARAAQVHDTLLHRPQKPRPHNASWILREQIHTELAPDDAAVVLATFAGGQFTVKDLLMALHGISPPGRPRNLGTAAGVEAFLQKSLRRPLQVAQAKAMGLDKDADFQKALHDNEDRELLGMVRMEKNQEITEPNAQEIESYYETVRDVVGKRDGVKVKVIWCRNRAAAAAAKTELAAGKAFAEVQQQYTTDTEGMQEKDLHASTEGFLWPEIWAAASGDVVGPLLGVHTLERTPKFAWRLLQVLGKEEGTPRALDDNLKNSLKWGIQGERAQAHFAAYAEKILAQYPFTVFEERLDSFDPRNIP